MTTLVLRSLCLTTNVGESITETKSNVLYIFIYNFECNLLL